MFVSAVGGVGSMVVVYRCSNCGFVLDIFVSSTRGVPTPSEVIAKYNGRCPRCGKPLSKPTFKDVDVKLHSKEFRDILAMCLANNKNACKKLLELIADGKI